MKVLISNNKGGVGKSFITTHLALATSQETPVVVWDTDIDQADTTKWLLGRGDIGQITPDKLYEINQSLAFWVGKEYILSENDTRTLLIDTDPDITQVEPMIDMADILLVPFKGGFSFDNAKLLLEEWYRRKKKLALGILNMVTHSQTIAMREHLRARSVGIKLFDIPIKELASVRKAEENYLPAWKATRNNNLFDVFYLLGKEIGII